MGLVQSCWAALLQPVAICNYSNNLLLTLLMKKIDALMVTTHSHFDCIMFGMFAALLLPLIQSYH
jgi:hypothetical protein